MQITRRQEGDVAVLVLQGKFMGGPETTAIYETVKELLAGDVKKVVIDLEQATLLNSSGLGIMLSAMTSLRRDGGDLRLCRLRDRMRGLFQVTNILSIFRTFDSVEEAVASFAGP